MNVPHVQCLSCAVDRSLLLMAAVISATTIFDL